MKMTDREQGDIVITDSLYLFWSGWPSQWFKVKFKATSYVANTLHDGIELPDEAIAYNCNEQYMMAEKARLFGDRVILKAILATDSPKEQKALGRKVTGFDAGRWDAVCREIVVAGSIARYSSDKRSGELLRSTGDRILVEASPKDKIWGIGLAPDDPRALIQSNWNGKNWLGEALMRVRHVLFAAKSGNTQD